MSGVRLIVSQEVPYGWTVPTVLASTLEATVGSGR
jgi:hypothetical protein